MNIGAKQHSRQNVSNAGIYILQNNMLGGGGIAAW